MPTKSALSGARRADVTGFGAWENGIAERFHKTVLNEFYRIEFYRIAFRKKLYASIGDLQDDLDLWIRSYNEERPHQCRLVFRQDADANIP